MSEQEQAQPERRYGSKFAEMFGYVKPEDRQRWEVMGREDDKNRRKSLATLRQGGKASMDAMLDFSDRNVNAKLSAAHKVAEQERFEESHFKTISTTVDKEKGTVTESVKYEEVDDSTQIEPDFEM